MPAGFIEAYGIADAFDSTDFVNPIQDTKPYRPPKPPPSSFSARSVVS